MFYVMKPEFDSDNRIQGWFAIQSQGRTRHFAEFAEAKLRAIKCSGRVYSYNDGNRCVYEHQIPDLKPREDRSVIKSQAERKASWAKFVESQLFVNAERAF